MATRNAILNLKTAGAKVIVDDIIWPDEPMFQDGIIAQAIDQVVSQGVTYFSAAGNESVVSYQSAFNPGNVVTINGSPETTHLFATGVNLQPITIPNGAKFEISLQWDSPSASAGGTGATNDLNVYLLNGSGSIVAFSRTNNIGGNAVEVPQFVNDTSTSGTTQFYLLITKAAGANPGLIKYVDFSAPNSSGQSVVYNNYLTGSSTLFGHANASSAIAVGAAHYTATPAFGTNPPAVESFSSYGSTPIIFTTTGTRLTTPIVRQKTDVVGPDGVNTTFFGTPDPVSTGPFEHDGFANFFGTSAAAPHVAALAALMLQVNPTLTPASIKQGLQQTAVDMDDPYLSGVQTGFDYATGYGLVSGLAALQSVTPPKVIGVTVDKSTGTVHPTYNVPTGSGEQIRTVPVGGANEIQIQFSENVTVAKSNLTLSSLRPGSGITYDLSTSTFSYDSTNHIAKWTFPSALAPDSILLTLSDGVTDSATNALDGEWTNPIRLGQTGTSSFPSGNGSPSGPFSFRFTILPGDANRDGRVTSVDQGIVTAHLGTSSGGTFTTGDTNGDGAINSTDTGIVNANLGLYFLFVRGDYNLNGTLDPADQSAMLSALTDLNAYKSTNHLSNDDLLAIGDLNNSGAVTNSDIQPLLDMLISGSGSNEWSPWDLTHDGYANWDDAFVLLDHWGMTGCSPADGDLNCDGCVDQLDSDLMIANWTG